MNDNEDIFFDLPEDDFNEDSDDFNEDSDDFNEDSERIRDICNRHYIFEDGKIKSVPLMEWARWFERADEVRRVDLTDISNEPNYPGGDRVSTVFLSLDHNFNFNDLDNHVPILFETMVFGGKYDQSGWRYATLGEAKKGHWQVVDCIRAGKKPEVDIGEKPAFEMFMDMLKEMKEDEDEEEDAD